MKYQTRSKTSGVPVRRPAAYPTLAGRTVLVTGGARGLGRAVVEVLRDHGATVVAADILEDELRTTVAELGGAQRGIYAVPVDLGDPASIARAVAAASDVAGVIDGLVNVAGVVRHSDPLAIPVDDWRFILGINLVGLHETTQQVVRRLRDAGASGAIVNIASEAGKVGHIDSLAYSASKAAVINATRMAAEALAADDINVNCICPGGMPTTMLRETALEYAKLTNEDPDAIYEQMIVGQLGRAVDLREVARVVAFLLSDDAIVIRGQAINADAGATPY